MVSSRAMSEGKDNLVYRLLLAVLGAVLLTSVICNVAFAWRNATLQSQVFAAARKLQQSNQGAQQLNSNISAIANDLVARSGQHPWLIPILQKYGLARNTTPAQPAPKKNP